MAVTAAVLAGGAFAVADAAASSSASRPGSTSGTGAEVASASTGAKGSTTPHAGWSHGGFAHGGAFAGGLGDFGGGLGGLGGGLGVGGGGLGLGANNRGTVTQFGNGTITITTAAGTSEKFDLSSSTKYFTMTTPGTSNSVAVGDSVLVDAAPTGWAGGHAGGRGPSTGSTGTSGGATKTAAADKPRRHKHHKHHKSSGSGTTTPTPTPPASGTPTAQAVIVIEPYAYGTVVSATSSEIVVTDQSGLERDVLVGSSTTTYTEAGQTIDGSAIVDGEQIFAWGAAATDPTQLQASNVLVVGPRVSGVVQSVSGTTITISSGWSGSSASTVSVTTNGSTLFLEGTTASSIGSIEKGDFLSAIGTSPSAGTFAATAVIFEAPPTATPGTSHGPSGTAYRGYAPSSATTSLRPTADSLEEALTGSTNG